MTKRRRRRKYGKFPENTFKTKKEKKVSKKVTVKTYLDKVELVFSPVAFSKLLHWRYNKHGVEVSGHGISLGENPLYLDDFELVKQESTPAYTEFDDDGWMDFMVKCHERGLQPWQYNNVCAHTHPGFGTTPSGTDETNWHRRISEREKRDFYVMCIVSNDEKTAYARLFVRKLSLAIKIPVRVDWGGSREFVNKEELDKQFNELVTPKSIRTVYSGYQPNTYTSGAYQGKNWSDNWNWQNRYNIKDDDAVAIVPAKNVNKLPAGQPSQFQGSKTEPDIEDNEDFAKVIGEDINKVKKLKDQFLAKSDELKAKTEQLLSGTKEETTTLSTAKQKAIYGSCKNCNKAIQKNLLKQGLCVSCRIKKARHVH